MTPVRSGVDRSRLPAPGPSSPAKFPAIDKSTLQNGLRVWSVPHAPIPVVTLMMLVARGAADDPTGREGLAALTVDMLDEGSGGRSAIEMHEALARIGGQLDSDIGPDAALLTVTVLSRFADRALELLADMVARPSLTETDVARVRQLRLHRLRQLRDLPGAVADRTFVRLIYGEHPYGHTSLGHEDALAETTAEDVRNFHRSFIRPGVSTLIAVGDLNHDSICRTAADVFAGWNGVVSHAEPSAVTALPTPPRLNIVPRPKATQSELRIGHVAAPRNTPDYHALVAANMVLGGQFVSRINLNLREDKGFTYGARTAFDFRRLPGPFALQVSVDTPATGRAIEESMIEIAGIRGSRPISASELSLGVAALTRGFPRNFETGEQIARAVTQIALYGLPDTYFSEFVPRVERLSVDDVTAAAARHLDPDRLTTLFVGDVERTVRDLDGLGLGSPALLSPDSF